MKSLLLKNKDDLNFDLNIALYLLEKVIFNDPRINCKIKGSKSDWKGLPPSKTMFHSKGLSRNKVYRIGTVILFFFKA